RSTASSFARRATSVATRSSHRKGRGDFRSFRFSPSECLTGSKTMRIELYTRPGCTLCDDARRLLQRVCVGRDSAEIDVDSDPGLRAEYGEFVRVVEVDGVRVGQWHIEEARLRAAIEGNKNRAPRRWFRRREARN